ncbi:MAG TPA: hypothetical protein PK867_26840, partial [Pirellulales bacterium]|nr:hypothetical protein [Pirellulales bacterium]
GFAPDAPGLDFGFTSATGHFSVCNLSGIYLSFYRAAGLGCFVFVDCQHEPPPGKPAASARNRNVLVFYLATGLGWIGCRRPSAWLPVFYRAFGLGPIFFDLSPHLDEEPAGSFAARTKGLLKEQAARRPLCPLFRQPPNNPLSG